MKAFVVSSSLLSGPLNQSNRWDVHYLAILSFFNGDHSDWEEAVGAWQRRYNLSPSKSPERVLFESIKAAGQDDRKCRKAIIEHFCFPYSEDEEGHPNLYAAVKKILPRVDLIVSAFREKVKVKLRAEAMEAIREYREFRKRGL